MLGEALVIFRDAEGKIGVLADRCPHRNLALSRGKVTGDGLRCAYHGWAWSTDGNCTKIPAACGSGDCSAIRVKSYEVEEQQGFVWVWMAAENGAASEGGPPEFPGMGEAGWRYFLMEREFEAAAFHCVENFLDVPHTAHVHRGLFRGEESKEIELEITSGVDWIEAEFIGEERMDSWIGKLLVPEDSEIRHTDRFQLPYVTRVNYRMSEKRQYIVMSQCTPVSENVTRVFTMLAFRFEPLGALVSLVFKPFAGRILDQDVDILREQTEDIERTGDAKFIFHETDAIARGIRDLIGGKSLEGREPERKGLRV